MIMGQVTDFVSSNSVCNYTRGYAPQYVFGIADQS